MEDLNKRIMEEIVRQIGYPPELRIKSVVICMNFQVQPGGSFLLEANIRLHEEVHGV